MTKIVLILLIALIFEAIGVVFLGEGLQQLGEVKPLNARNVLRLLGQGATNKYILLGVAFEAIFFGALLYLLARADVSFIWPLTSLGFVITTLAARIFRHEEISFVRWAGVILIVLWAMIVGWSEHQKLLKAKAAAKTIKVGNPTSS